MSTKQASLAGKMLNVARNRKLSKAERVAIAKHAAVTRWTRQRQIRRLQSALAKGMVE